MNKPTLSLDNLESIGLEELNSDASLLTRKDRKYVVPLVLAQELVDHADLRVLEIDGLRTFRYESVYFDTPDRISYLAAAHKRRRRFKVRTRSYLDSGLCSLEVKTRERRGLTKKHRISHDIARRSNLTEDALEFIDAFETIAPHSEQLAPVLTTRYTRTTLLEPSSMSRITIDTGLECEKTNGSYVAIRGMAVIETKTSGQPCAVDRFLWDRQQRPTRISKYCTGLAALTPGLPANKWNGVLRTHFGWTPQPAGATPRCRNPDKVTRLEPVPSLEGVGS